jgi:uncharacterized protein with NRDE domain
VPDRRRLAESIRITRWWSPPTATSSYARPTAIAARWPDAPQIIGGIDLEAGGTWLGITESARFAAVTNVREPNMAKAASSRGALTRDFLLSNMPAGDFAQQIEGSHYAGFNLLLSDGESLVYCSNRDGKPRALPARHLRAYPIICWIARGPNWWQARQRFTAALQHLPEEAAFFELLADQTIVEDDKLPQTGVPLEWERLLSAVFVKSENYGTRASTLLWQGSDGTLKLHEQSFGPNGQALQSSVISTSL